MLLKNKLTLYVVGSLLLGVIITVAIAIALILSSFPDWIESTGAFSLASAAAVLEPVWSSRAFSEGNLIVTAGILSPWLLQGVLATPRAKGPVKRPQSQ